MSSTPPTIVSAALLVRDDGQVLLVRYADEHVHFGGLWSLPMQAVTDEETADDALERVLRERLHVQREAFEFTDTLYFATAAGGRYIVNLFTCTRWGGVPRFAEQHYVDAAWVEPGRHAALALVPELGSWLDASLAGPPATSDPAAVAVALGEARSKLLAAYDAIAEPARTRRLDGAWTPLDVLAHAGSVEAYYAAEARRLLDVPGHTWRLFNTGQWEDDHRSREPEPESAVRARLERLRARTRAWLETLSADDLERYGNHPERGVVTVGERVDQIAWHDREHASQLRAMAASVEEAGDGD